MKTTMNTRTELIQDLPYNQLALWLLYRDVSVILPATFWVTLVQQILLILPLRLGSTLSTQPISDLNSSLVYFSIVICLIREQLCQQQAHTQSSPPQS